jgi:hypothetical protein
MNLLTTSSKLQVGGDTHHTLTRRNAATRSAENSRVRNTKRSSRSSLPANSKLLLGEAVRHSRFGAGQVLAHSPDGTVLVRFEGTAKNVPVWPSFLQRVNGRWS